MLNKGLTMRFFDILALSKNVCGSNGIKNKKQKRRIKKE